ncbi:TonB-dependent receptor [Parahaliea sp. F7430]|uniref:TonB-dependent receptor n=1 Tax=Sediminihaliea albiluteola TaxID=2758564 RepID=A0A7W2YJB2_9GAMM|nr:TonB-dependent receptor [Sediminihaliea albiluteola]MBA6412444.1 TonB-dependent receptor [Sediminihaliea albiluteola]
MNPFKRHVLVAAVLTAVSSAHAQSVLEEVVVTAQKRSENVLDVPIAMSVFSANAVEKLSARNLTDLGRFTPGVEMNNDNALQPTYTIRGVETNDFTVGSDPAIAVYVDGVYAARGAGAEAALTDIARVEVLKGPQGTLFGRNATGGAIHVVSQPPVYESEGRAKISVGNYNRLDGEFMYNLPISESLALRAVAVKRQRDGFLKNISGPDMSEENMSSYRASLLWDASPNTEILWRVEYSELDQNGGAQFTLVDSVFAGGNPGMQLDPYGKIANDFESREKREMYASSLEINHQLGDLTLTSITGWRQFETELLEDLDGSNNPDYVFNSSNPDDNEYFSQEFRLSGASDKLKWTTGLAYSRETVEHSTSAEFNFSTLESFAWAEILRNSGSDTSQAFLSALAGLDQDQIDALGSLSRSEVSEVLPSYRQQQKDNGIDGIAMSAFIWSFLNDQGTLEQFGIATNPVQGLFQILNDVAPRIASYQPWVEKVDTSGTYESYALYGDATWSINEKMNLSGGLRYTYDEKRFNLYTAYQNQISGADFGLAFYNNGQAIVDSSQKDSWDSISGRLVLDYHLDDDQMAYASVATGFKSGGFNSLNFGPNIDTSYDEEEVINYELGFKSQLLEGRAQFNAAAFFYEYDNLQELKLLGQPIPSYNLRNADAEGYGIELEGYWLASERLALSGNYSWLKTKYTRFNLIEAAGETAADDLTGEPRVGTPEHKVNLALEYTLPIEDFGEVVSRLDYTWNDERVSSLTDPTRKVDAYDLANLRISFVPAGGRWEASLWSTNLFDEEVITVFGSNGDAIGSLTGWRIPPRMYGMDLLFHF